MRHKRILITAGGTGGHLYPAQALAQQCQKRGMEVLFVAGGLASNRHFDQHCFPFQEIPCSPLLSFHPWKSLKGIGDLFKGSFQSRAILKHYSPDVVVGFGSYHTVAVLLAARWLNIPIVLHEANSVPGKANRWLSSLATRIGVHFPSASAYFNQKKTVEVGLPLREGYSLKAVDKQAAIDYYGLSPHRKTLLICGGSQGARAINQWMEKCLPVFQELSLQLIHFTGDSAIAERLSILYAAHAIPACVKAYESQMHMAWRAADGFIARSGASTIAEVTEFEVPGILIPYPHATNQHQEKNADFLVATIQSAWKILEGDLSIGLLQEKIKNLFEEKQLLAFKKALKTYKESSCQMTLCDLVFNLNA